MSPSTSVVSQSSIDVPKQPLSWRKVIIILFVSAVVLVGTAVLVGFLTKSDEPANQTSQIDDPFDSATAEERRQMIEDDKIYAISGLTEIYNYKGVKLEEVIEEEREVAVGTDSVLRTIRSYYKVVGLKDKTIEAKINAEIKAAYDQALERYGRLNTRIYCNVEANFGGLLSIEVHVSDQYDPVTTLVFRLDTGEAPKFNDLFLKGTSIAAIVEDALYQDRLFALQEDCYYDYDTRDECLRQAASKVNMAEIEQAIHEYRSNPDLKFSIDSRLIYFELKNSRARVQLELIWDKIAFYKRFENDDLIADAVQFRSFVFSDLAFAVEMEGNNLIIAKPSVLAPTLYETSGYDTSKSEYKIPKSVKSTAIKTKATMIAEVKDYSKKHPDKIIFIADMRDVPYCRLVVADHYLCSVGFDAFESRHSSDSALQDIAAGYRLLRGGFHIQPLTASCGGDDSGIWAELQIGSLAKTSLRVSSSGEIIYWGP